MSTEIIALESLIPTRPHNERVWIVRASGGRHVRHFKHAGVVAIGHIDRFNLAPEIDQIGAPLTISLAEMASRMESIHSLSKRTIASQLSQVRRFCQDFRAGDLVVTVDSHSVAVGRIRSAPFLDRTPVDLSTNEYKDQPMGFQLRRHVAWGPTFSRKDLPIPMERIFNSHQTVFEATKYWDYIYHLLYPAFIFNDELHLSLRVRQDDAIKNRNVADLLYILQDFENLAARLTHDQNFDSLTVRAGFFSKGDIWPRLTAKEKKIVTYLLLTGFLLCGGEIGKIEAGPIKIGPFKFNGAIDVVLKIIEAAKPIMDERSGSVAVENMKIEVPHHDTSGMEKNPLLPPTQGIILASQ